MSSLTNAQFEALAELLRLRNGRAQEAARAVLVDHDTVADAAARVGMPYKDAHAAVARAQRGLELVRRVADGGPV